ncbi:MAG: hypothetical protein JWP78_3189 [Mucilaginibacter sp.]|nr:hypothetical protein [Mucilaginibacter sp.]
MAAGHRDRFSVPGGNELFKFLKKFKIYYI